MTNYERLVKNNAELVKEILSYHLSKEEGVPSSCSKTLCSNCDFGNGRCLPFCVANAKEWLEAEPEPLYKKGDVVIDSDNQLAVIKEDDCGGDLITISHYADDTTGVKVLIKSIKKKVGHIEIEETDEPSLCASCKSEECILQTGVIRRHCDFYKAESETKE